MKENFQPSLLFTLTQEGGFSDNPDDPGEATYQGITLATLRDFTGQTDLNIDDLRAISSNLRDSIYSVAYWTSTYCDELPAGIDLMVFDHAVNCGAEASIRLLQSACNIQPDGYMGPETLAAAAHVTIPALQAMQHHYYMALSGYVDFGRGWLARLQRRTARAIALANGE